MGTLSVALAAVLLAYLQLCSASAVSYYYCGPPNSVSYGGYFPQQKIYPVGKRVEFYCSKGYILVGQRWTVCLYNRNTRKTSWAHPPPVCKRIECPDLPDPRYGSVKLSGNTPGSTATYTCDYGFKLVGESTRKCQGNGEWDGKAPVCVPITCPDLPDPKYGSVKLTGNRVGDKAFYQCDKGFILKGDRLRKCLITGYWSGDAPVCVPITCPDLPDPKYGSVELTGNRVGDKANYQCDKGFRLKGDKQRKCLITGYWSGDAPVCVPITCPDLPDPKYGSVELTGNRVGDKANYQCDKGFRLKGDKQRKCLITGYWSGDAPVCVPITCPDLPDPKYGSVKLTGNRVGDKAFYRCDKGFILKGDRQRKCLITGYWSGDAPVCVPITCPDLPDPKYGSVKLTGNRVGDKANYWCNKGFILKGDRQRKCLITGYWSGDAPVCVPITCPDLPDPKYGSVKLTGNRVGDKAFYRCDKGFILKGDRQRKCLITGYWSGDAPVCVPITCPNLPNPAYGYVRVSGNRPGAKADYGCKKGFKLVGASWRKCLYDGSWSGSAPICKRVIIDCGKPPAPKYGYVKYTSTTQGSRAYYSCAKGYYLKGPSDRVCLYSGYWHDSVPVCLPVYH